MRVTLRNVVPIGLSSIFALFAALEASGCTTGAPGEVAATATESALRKLASNEILGTLSYGQTSAPVAYTDTPRYRAFAFQGAAGDKVDAWVRSTTGGDARAWLLAADFTTLASNGDADPETKDSHITKTLTASGTFYIAFREENQEDATFVVSLANARSGGTDGGTDAGNDAGAAGSIWDDALLNAPPITLAAAKARFAPGSTSVDVGSFEVAQRTRQCNTTTGCGAWTGTGGVTFDYMSYELWIPGPGWSPQKDCFQFEPVTFPSITGAASLVIGTGGRIDLKLSSTATGSLQCADVTTGGPGCGNLTSSGVSPSGGKSCDLPNPAGGGFDPLVYPASVTPYDTTSTEGSALSFSARVTANYAIARASSKSKQAADGSYREVEYALYASLTNGPLPSTGTGTACVPKTCAQVGATCGSVADGCGGQVLCGSCSYPYHCGQTSTCELPPNCNLQPCYAGASVTYTCCSPGQVTCSNGQGCTCYDACF